MRAVENVSALLASHSGRDKIHKIGQYGARIAMWYYQGNKAAFDKASKFKSLMGDVRRVGYMFGSLDMIPELADDLAAPVRDTRWLVKTIADVADFVYFLCDNLPFLADFGMFPMAKATRELLYDEYGTRLWFVSTTCWLYLSARDVAALRRKPKTDETAAEAHKRRSATTDARLRLVAALCNWLIGYFFIFPNRPINSSMAGAFGVLNACIGIYLRMKPKTV